MSILMYVSGIGEIDAATLIAEIGNFEYFYLVDKLASQLELFRMYTNLQINFVPGDAQREYPCQQSEF